MFTLDADKQRPVSSVISRTSAAEGGGLLGADMTQGRGSQEAGWVSFGLTADSVRAERAELITIMLLQGCIIYSVASTTSASIHERLEHELQTNRRNDQQERHRQRLRYRRKRVSFWLHFTSNKHWDRWS